MRGPVPWAAILPELPELRQAMRRGIPEISHILNLTIMEFKTLTNIQSAFDRIRLVVVLVLAGNTLLTAVAPAGEATTSPSGSGRRFTYSTGAKV